MNSRWQPEEKILNELSLQFAIEEGNVKEIKRLAKAGTNLDLYQREGSLLLSAAVESKWSIVELLMDLGANVYISYSLNEWKILHHACKCSQMSVLQKYIDKKFDLDVITSKGETALMIASDMNNKPVLEMLVKAGANLNHRDRAQKAALHYAAVKGQIDIVKFLVDNKADVNVQDGSGSTALHLILKKRYCDVEMVVLLVRGGVDCNIANNVGITAFSLLVKKKLLEAIKLAIENGAYVKASDYSKLSGHPLLKNNILKSVNYCSQAIINKYNYKDLPDLYKIAFRVLPPIENFKIYKNSDAAKEIARSVNQDIEKRKRGCYCHLTSVRPFNLSKMCVEFLNLHIRAIDQLHAKQFEAAVEAKLATLKDPVDRIFFRKGAKRIRLLEM